jgi:hypothetical protein
MAIRDIPQGTPTTDVQVPYYDPAGGCDRRASLSSLLDAAGSAQLQTGWYTQYAAPGLTGFVAAVDPPVDGTSTWLQLRPTAAFAAGNVTLPLPTSTADGQEVLVTTTQAITTFTCAGNGSTVNGAPTTMAANSFFRLRFDGIFKDWSRVG